jgi:hypothetical protein
VLAGEIFERKLATRIPVLIFRLLYYVLTALRFERRPPAAPAPRQAKTAE